MEQPTSRVLNSMSTNSTEARLPRRRRSRGCCRGCNSQVFCSYVLALISTSLVVGGVYLSIFYWDRIWLVFSAAGLVMVFVGSCMYYCGVQNLKRYDSEEDTYRRRRRQKHRGHFRDRGLSGDELVPSAPTMAGRGNSRSVSQLSLNMIPQYFARTDTSSLSSVPAQPSTAYSQIFSVNGQSFLILPLSADALPSSGGGNANQDSNSIPLNGLVVKIPISGREIDNLRKTSITEFLGQDPKGSNCQSAKGERAANQGDEGLMSITSTLATTTAENTSTYFKNLRLQQQQQTSTEGNPTPASSSSSSNSSNEALVCSKQGQVPSGPRQQPSSGARTSIIESSTGTPCSSVNATSYFISFAHPEGSSSRGPQRTGNNQHTPQIIGATVRSSIRRQETFKQSRPGVAFSSLQTSDQNASLGASGVANEPRNYSCDSHAPSASEVLIDLSSPSEPSSSHRQTGTNGNGLGGAPDDMSAFNTVDIDEDEADAEITEDFTPPPSYAEVYDEESANQYASAGHGNHDGCGTL